jgi:hypothetical protein
MKGMFGKAMGYGKKGVAAMKASKAVKGARIAGSAGKNIARGMGQAASQAASGAKRMGSKVMNTKPKDLMSSLGKVARNPKKMRKLGKSLAKYGAAGAAGYYMGKD